MSDADRRPVLGDFNRRRPSLSLATPFGLVCVVGLLTLLVPPVDVAWPSLVLAVLVLALVAALVWFSTVRDERSWVDLAAVYLTFLFVALARDAGGGSASGLSALLFVPILWLAITGTWVELYIGGALAGLTIVVPMVLTEGGAYSDDDWRRAAILAAIAFVLGRVVQRIVLRLERETWIAKSATERNKRLFLDAPYGVAVLDRLGRIEIANKALGAILGVSAKDLAGRWLTELSSPGDATLEDHLDRAVEGQGKAASADGTMRDADGNDVHVALSSRVLRAADPQGSGATDIVLLNVVDVSERRRYQDRLAHLVDHDVLTGLANRRRFDNELQRHLDRCRRYGNTGAVLLLDLDNFKQVNDSLGHSAGDQLIVGIAGLLRRTVRHTDLVARLGGDEFAVLLTDGDEDVVRRVGQHIIDVVREHAATLDGVRRRVTASVGGVTFQAASEQAGDILALADMTMYDAKESGRNQLALLPEGETRAPRFSARLQWQSRIEDALDEDRFELHLQPIMEVATGKITAAEVLLRMREHDELVPPTRFIYIAERTGLMPRVDAWVVERSVELLARLREHHPDFKLEVNLSGHSIGHPEIELAIRDSLARHQVDPAALILEITETAAVADVAMAREFAVRMTELGCAFALDDFGAGFGSFYYLKHLFFDYVKIDGEFVAHVHESSIDCTIMRSIVGIAHDLGKKTVAEYVAAPEILDVVRAEGVDYAQGFLIGRPAPYEEFLASLGESDPSLAPKG